MMDDPSLQFVKGRILDLEGLGLSLTPDSTIAAMTHEHLFNVANVSFFWP